MITTVAVTPDTLLAWHRKFIAEKWTFQRKGRGRSRIAQEIIDLVVRIAMENVSWGYERISPKGDVARRIGGKVTTEEQTKIVPGQIVSIPQWVRR